MIDLSTFIPTLNEETRCAREAVVSESNQPRLVVADWLEANGHGERADFIRVQCRINHEAFDITEGGHPECQCGRCELRSKLDMSEYELWRVHGSTFAKGLPGDLPAILPGCIVSSGIPQAMTFQFRRGFVEMVILSTESWLRHAEELTKAHPIRQATLTSPPRPALFWGGFGYAAYDVNIESEFKSRWPLISFEWPRIYERTREQEVMRELGARMEEQLLTKGAS